MILLIQSGYPGIRNEELGLDLRSLRSAVQDQLSPSHWIWRDRVSNFLAINIYSTITGRCKANSEQLQPPIKCAEVTSTVSNVLRFPARIANPLTIPFVIFPIVYFLLPFIIITVFMISILPPPPSPSTPSSELSSLASGIPSYSSVLK